MGEAKRKALVGSGQSIALDTFGGRIHVEWDPAAAVTPLGQLPFFIEFLKVSGLFDAWVADCPLTYTSNNASDKRAVLATFLLSILAGHHRYAHITAIRHDGIHPELLGVAQLVSEDAARRALARMEASSGVAWLDRHLAKTTQPLLATPWILDLDATVKCLYGKQEGALVGYNPKKPGRPSHGYHSALMANTRLALAVEVLPGNATAPLHSMPGIWTWLDTLPKAECPALLRGDIAYGCESGLHEAEARDQPYLTKLRLTKNVKRLIKKLFRSNHWINAGQGWEGVEDTLTLSGLKNQWGWGGFTTQDLARCRLMARLVALVYNWWTLFVRLANPDKHHEAITSRPLLLHGVATQTKHAGHTADHHQHPRQAIGDTRAVRTRLAGFLSSLKATAEQWTDAQRLRAILTRAFVKFMRATVGPPAMAHREMFKMGYYDPEFSAE